MVIIYKINYNYFYWIIIIKLINEFINTIRMKNIENIFYYYKNNIILKWEIWNFSEIKLV